VFVCVCAFFCVCVQVDALRRADHPPKDLENRSETESSMEVGQGPIWGCSAEEKNLCITSNIYPNRTGSSSGYTLDLHS
jgi:hypothetical protein